MGQSRLSRIPPSRFFPPPEAAGKDGLVAVGGNMQPETLVEAYRHGIFPWPAGQVLAWWSPDPRAIVELDALHVSHRLRRRLRGGFFEVTCDRDFSRVIDGCATAQERKRATWITPALRYAYERMHRAGYAHSIEVWHDQQLAGGLYGVAIGSMFAAESMFYRLADASKVALAYLVRHLLARGYELFDIQQLTPHTARMGGTEIPRSQFLARLNSAVDQAVTFGESLECVAADW